MVCGCAAGDTQGFYPRHPCGWRLGIFCTALGFILFLSTPPVWVATSWQWTSCRCRCFYPRHPCGWRRITEAQAEKITGFLSTPPVWVATGRRNILHIMQRVSIHATRVGGDRCGNYRRRDPGRFYPRHPCGWRRAAAAPWPSLRVVSIHATRVGGDDVGLVLKCAVIRFLSTPPVWVATCDSDGSRAAY